MTKLRTFLLTASLCVQGLWCVTPSDLQKWFAAPSGLAMSQQDAAVLASSKAFTLTQCGVTVKTLQALKDAMSDHSGLELQILQVRTDIFDLAEQHVSPDKLGRLYQALSTSYTLSGGLGFDKALASQHTMALVRGVEPDQLKALYKVMYGYYGLGFTQEFARSTAISLAILGSDAAQFQETYTQEKNKGSSMSYAVALATEEAVKANMFGFVRRYAANDVPYTAEEFQKYYNVGQQWLTEWKAGPLEKRVSTDHRAYTASQFSRHFSSSTWAAKYRSSPEATQKRLAGDGKAYTMHEFQQYYGNTWRATWSSAPELACAECSPYAGKVGSASLVV